MNIIDWLIMGGTLAAIVIYGVVKTRNINTAEGYLRGDRDLKWWTIGLSVMATQASAITFLSTPGQAYEDGMGFAQFYFGLPIAMVILCVFVLPIYYRLNVFPIELAPLCERTEDIPLLIDVLLKRVYDEQRLNVRFSVEAMQQLREYPWPGNVRELSNLLQRMAIQYPNEIVKRDDLPRKILQPSEQPKAAVQETASDEIMLPVNGIDLKDYLTRLERSLIEQALVDANAVVARAADKLKKKGVRGVPKSH